METSSRAGPAQLLLPAGSRTVTCVSPDSAAEKQPLLPGSSTTAELARQEDFWMVSHEVIFGCVALSWLAFGVLFLVLQEGFTVLEALYLTVQLVTTVGYGDIPVSTVMEGFLCVYLLGCVVLVAFVLSKVTDAVTKISTGMLRSSMRAAERRMGLAGDDEDATLYFGHLNDLIAGTLIFACFLLVGWIFYANVEACTCGTEWRRIPGCSDGHSCPATGGRVLTTWGALYMSIVTLTTVGFGDYSPGSTAGVIFSLFWTVAGVAACANFVRACASFFRWASRRRSYLLQERISKELFQEMDVTKDGRLSQVEFLRYLLLKYELVDRQVLDDIRKQYDLLDPGGTNSVSFEAIQAVYAEHGIPQTPTGQPQEGEDLKFFYASYDATEP